MKKSRVFRQLVTIECIAIVGAQASPATVEQLDFEAYVRDGVGQASGPDVYVTAGEASSTAIEELTP